MRTTLTVDDDLMGILKERARKRGVPFRDVVNETLRAALHPEGVPAFTPPEVIPHSFGFEPGIDTDRLGQLADELEAQAYADSIRQQSKK